MPPSPAALLSKLKRAVMETALPSLLMFGIAKLVFSILELPHAEKSSTYIPFLLISLVFFGAAAALKIFHHRFDILRKILHLELSCFLIWVITVIFIIFTWSLCDALSWNLFEKILLVLCQILTTFLVTLLSDPRFISKAEFIGY